MCSSRHAKQTEGYFSLNRLHYTSPSSQPVILGCLLASYDKNVLTVNLAPLPLPCQAHPLLRTSALLALTKLMAIDATFCDTNMQLFFTLLTKRCGSQGWVRV